MRQSVGADGAGFAVFGKAADAIAQFAEEAHTLWPRKPRATFQIRERVWWLCATES